MSEVNPYASPMAVAAPRFVLPQSATEVGAWRQGNVLVMHQGFRLADRCIKSNQPAAIRLRRTLYWHHPAIYLLILVSPLLYIIVALVLRKQATVFVGLSRERAEQRRVVIATAWGLAALMVAAFFLGIALSEQGYGLLIPVGIIGLLGAAIYGLVASRTVHAKKIVGDYVWLKGVQPDYLAELPVLPYRWK